MLVEEYKVEWHVIEQLKQQNLMEWVRKMNVIENIVDEVIISNNYTNKKMKIYVRKYEMIRNFLICCYVFIFFDLLNY